MERNFGKNVCHFLQPCTFAVSPALGVAVPPLWGVDWQVD